MNRVIIATVVGLLLLTSCGSHSDKPSTQPTETATTTSPTVTATPSPTDTSTTSGPPTIIDYSSKSDEGVLMTSAADTKQLTGAPADFTAFIASELAKDQAKSDKACTEKPQIYVQKLDPEGWAAGGHFIPQCGGYATLWAKVSGSWKEVWSGQELTDCKTLKKYRFPVGIAGKTCLQGDNQITYVP